MPFAIQKVALISVITLLGHGITFGQSSVGNDFLIMVNDSATGDYGYRDAAGKIVIPMGKYPTCYTDTFRNYAIVSIPGQGIVGIDRQERVLYHVFIFDNGPDEAVDRLFRIVVEGKIGYADSATGRVTIQPRFACAWPFEKGRAKVAVDCQTRKDGEYHTWLSNHWFYIDEKGRRQPDR
jgi:hypothetical protein